MMTALWWDGESGRVAMAGPMYEGFPHVHVHAALGVLLKPATLKAFWLKMFSRNSQPASGSSAPAWQTFQACKS